ncbi:type VII secretion integral membrane protein EccD, partial [Streptomyces sp. SM14]
MLAVAAVAAFAALFLALAVVATGAAAGGALMMTTDLAVGEVAGVLALASVICGALVPSLSFRMSGLKMPPLPTNAKQLQEGIEPHSPSAVKNRTVLADGWMTGLYGAIAVLCAACLLGLSLRPTLAQVLTMVALSLLLLLHARALGNTVQRLSLVAPGVLGVALLAFGLATTTTTVGRLLLTAGLLAVAAALAIASWTVPGRRLVPYWGRAAELLQSAAAISMLPLTLWALGVYGALRSING